MPPLALQNRQKVRSEAFGGFDGPRGGILRHFRVDDRSDAGQAAVISSQRDLRLRMR